MASGRVSRETNARAAVLPMNIRATRFPPWEGLALLPPMVPLGLRSTAPLLPPACSSICRRR